MSQLMLKILLTGYQLNWEFLARKSQKKQQKMSAKSTSYQIPNYNFIDEEEEKSPVFELFDELNAISEEIEQCRLKAAR